MMVHNPDTCLEPCIIKEARNEPKNRLFYNKLFMIGTDLPIPSVYCWNVMVLGHGGQRLVCCCCCLGFLGGQELAK